jgi:RHS repeat-associated protein
MRRVSAVAILGFAVLLPRAVFAAAPLAALAPVETVIDAQAELVGVAVLPDGTRYVSDRSTGVVHRIDADGGAMAIVTGLARPAGLAIGGDGRLLIAEEKAGRVLRLEPNGSLTVLAAAIKTPRWIAVAADGALYVSAHRLAEPDGADDTEGRVIVRLAPGHAPTVVASGIRRLEGLAQLDGGLVAATKGLEAGPSSAGTLLRYPVLADGTLGPPVAWLDTGLKQPVGIVADALGSVFVSSKDVVVDRDVSKRAIGKIRPGARLADFATNLGDPQGVAFGPDGALYLADGRAGRLLRFVPPSRPAMTVPPLTAQSSLAVTGTATAGARVDVFVDDATAAAVSGVADAAGRFALGPVMVRANAVTTLDAYATTHAGDGLTSTPAISSVQHDDVSPGLDVQAPPEGAHVRGTVAVAARATDAGSGVVAVTVTVGGHALNPTLAPPPPAPSVMATASWVTPGGGDGPHTLTVTAADRAGNTASIARTVIVDNTPPDTEITSGPSAVDGSHPVAFAFTGSDNLTPAGGLVFSWRFDGGAWSAFAPATSASVSGLHEGAHTFEVKARDAAGNEDPTPAAWTFTVHSGPSITLVEPASGPVGTLVTIAGGGFEPGTTSVAFGGTAAIIRTVTATTITTTVPLGATSGSLIVTTTGGSASRLFGVPLRRDFALVVEPASLPAAAGTSVSVAVRTPATGAAADLIELATGALPPGVTASFWPPVVTALVPSVLTLTVDAAAPAGATGVEIRATARIDGLAVVRTAHVTLAVHPPGSTMLIGQVRDRGDRPLAGVRILLGGATLTPLGESDAGGNFFLPLSVSGTQTLLLDGSGLNTPAAFWPTVPLTMTITPGVVNPLGFVPRLEAMPATKLVPIVPGQHTVLTDPALPGFQMTIPAGVQIIGWDGYPNTQVGVTAIAVDRSPLPPPPPGVTASTVFLFSFGKLGGGVPTGPVVIDGPNVVGALPGEQVELHYFNEAPDGTAPNQWEKYGTATVSGDGQRLLTDVNPATGQRYGMPRFCCGAWMPVRPTPAPDDGPSGGAGDAGHDVADPVDAATGFFYLRKTDLVLPGIVPVAVTRTYRTNLTGMGPFGRGTSWEWDPFVAYPFNRSPSVLMLFTPGNRQDLFTQQPDGTLANGTSPALRGATVAVDPGGYTLRFKGGGIWRFDTTGRLESRRDRTGNAVTLTRDAQRRITAITEPRGRQLAIRYDGTSVRITGITDPLGREVQYTYDDAERLATVTDPAGGVTRYTYDAAHRMVALTDARGITFLVNEYDAAGRVVRQTQADGGVWTLEYLTSGSAVSETTVTDPRGHATRYRFSAAGYPESVTDALGQTTTYTREPGTNLVRAATDPLGRVTQFTHDPRGNVTAITDAAGHIRTFTYEPTFDRMTSSADPLGNVTRFEYDGHGNLTAAIDPLGNRTEIAYNGAGQPASTTDALGNTTTFGYDAHGNLATVVDPLGNVTRRDHDLVGRLRRQQDAMGNAAAFLYDALDRVTAIGDAGGGATRFGYDPNGNLLAVTDARGHTTTHTYDAMDRLASRTDPVGATETFEYDGNGNLVRHIDRKGQVATFDHDALDRRTTATYADATVTYVHDAAGRLVTAADSAGGTIENEYDALDRLVAQTQSLGTVSYEYDPLGRRALMQAPGAAPVTYGYDAASRLASITQGPQFVQFEHDAAGRRTKLTLPNQVSTEYRYDAASRISALLYRNAAGPLGDLTYEYDASGNRVGVGGSFARTLLPDAAATSAYDAGNRQLAFGEADLAYDLNGNLASDGENTYTWNARNQLAAITGPIASTFGYDGFGRRQSKTIAGMRTDFLHDGVNALQELRGGEVTDLLTGLNIDEHLSRTGASGTRSFVADALGSTVALIADAGMAKTEYTYSPFGETTSTGASTGNPFDYTGRESDGTGLKYYRARYYHPRLARFLGEDPIGFAGGLHLYAYADNNPTTLKDPLGLATLSICVKGVIGVGVGGGGGTCINFGFDRKHGFSTSVTGSAGGGGFAGIGGTAGISIGMSNARTVFDLTGGSVSLGAGGGAFIVGGASAFTSTSPPIRGGEIFGGFGLLLGTGLTSPVAVEGFVNTTSTILGFGTRTGFVGPSR